MTPKVLTGPLRAGIAFVLAWVAASAFGQVPSVPAESLRPFTSDDELLSYFEPFAAERRKLEEEQRRHEEQRRQREAELQRRWEAEHPGEPWSPPRRPVASPAPAAAPAPGGPGAGESVTNNQVAGVDEGGIVKVHGKHLVILRRGRLFTVSVAAHELAPVASLPAYGRDVDPRNAWYDEMLVSGNTVVVIGYSYARGGTELGLFDIDDAGRLSHRATYHLKSSDYYSSRNYASRLVGQRLVLYAPVTVSLHHADPLERLPSLRRWQPGSGAAEFRRIAPPTRIYRTDEPLRAERGAVTLHTVTSCDLSQVELQCTASAAIGGSSRVFHVSGTAVYVWTTDGEPGAGSASAVLRLPLDGGAPSALKTQGSPIDQFSFQELDGRLDVLVRANGGGDGMWRGEQAGGPLSLLRVHVGDFSDGRRSAPPGAYHPLPSAGEGSLQNRFVGKYLLYGSGNAGRRPVRRHESLQVVDLHSIGAPVEALPLPHAIDRIEAVGGDAVAIGSDGRDLHFSSIRLAGVPRVASHYRRAAAGQAESRSHGFFYKPDDANRGLIGLPIRGGAEGTARQPWDEPAGMLYLRNERLQLSEVGNLWAAPGIGKADRCEASCSDWYGNARPLFLNGRMFALMGYEIVEGRVLGRGERRRLVELRRISYAFAPPERKQ